MILKAMEEPSNHALAIYIYALNMCGHLCSCHLDSYVIFSIIASAGTQALITNWVLSTLQCFVTLNVQVYLMKSYIMHPSIYGT